MTFAPQPLRELAAYWVAHGGVNLGIVGDTRHVTKGRSYHLGKSALTPDAYSRTGYRDRAGLSEAASAIDLGRLEGSYVHLRTFSRWLVKHCQAATPGTLDIREVIYSPDGKLVLRWDRERGVKSDPKPGEADASHLGHTHVSFYRDSETRSKVGAFAPYFAPPKEDDMAEDRGRLIRAIAKRAEYLANEDDAGDILGVQAQAIAIIGFAARLAGVLPPASNEAADAGTAEVNEEWFTPGIESDTPHYIAGPTADGSASGNLVTMTTRQEVAWWRDVFGHRYDLSQVRSGLNPGIYVLSPAGVVAARSLKGSGNLAPADYNPLGLEVVP